MSDPPGKGIGGSREAAAQTIVPPDATPLFCNEQGRCEHSSTRIEQIIEPGSHQAREVCIKCGSVISWISPCRAPRSFHGYRLVKLVMTPGLTDAEHAFLDSILRKKQLSPEQQEKLDRLYAERAGGSR
jgi:hypothetical protein